MKRTYKWLPVIDSHRCTGCGSCVAACAPASLKIIDNVAVLVDPDTCGSEEHCIAPCLERAIKMAWVPIAGDRGRGVWK